MLLAAHAQGFGGKWLTGANAYDEHVKAALGLAADDRLVGFVHIGTVAGRRRPCPMPIPASTPSNGRLGRQATARRLMPDRAIGPAARQT